MPREFALKESVLQQELRLLVYMNESPSAGVRYIVNIGKDE